MDRRQFIEAGATLIAALATAGLAGCSKPPWPDKWKAIVALFPPATRDLGEAAHEDVFGEQSLDQLKGRLDKAGTALDTKTAAASWLRAEIQADFTAARTVSVDRWHLAEIEALVCATAHVLS
jgi:hypothetical protein